MSDSPSPVANSPVINEMATLENGEVLPVTRDEAGRFVPGVSGNPSGRPATASLTEYLKIKVEELGYGAKIGDDLVSAAAGEKQLKPGQLDAAAVVMDRVYGKAVQNSNVRGLIVMVPTESVLIDSFSNDEPGQ